MREVALGGLERHAGRVEVLGRAVEPAERPGQARGILPLLEARVRLQRRLALAARLQAPGGLPLALRLGLVGPGIADQLDVTAAIRLQTGRVGQVADRAQKLDPAALLATSHEQLHGARDVAAAGEADGGFEQ